MKVTQNSQWTVKRAMWFVVISALILVAIRSEHVWLILIAYGTFCGAGLWQNRMGGEFVGGPLGGWAVCILYLTVNTIELMLYPDPFRSQYLGLIFCLYAMINVPIGLAVGFIVWAWTCSFRCRVA